MSLWNEAATRANRAFLRVGGDTVTYLPSHALGEPVVIQALFHAPTIDQSAAPGYFADIEIDPSVILTPERKDEVILADGSAFVVSLVRRSEVSTMWLLAIHRKFDR